MTEFTPKQNIPFLALNEEELRKQAHASYPALFGGTSPLEPLWQKLGQGIGTPSYEKERIEALYPHQQLYGVPFTPLDKTLLAQQQEQIKTDNYLQSWLDKGGNIISNAVDQIPHYYHGSVKEFGQHVLPNKTQEYAGQRFDEQNLHEIMRDMETGRGMVAGGGHAASGFLHGVAHPVEVIKGFFPSLGEELHSAVDTVMHPEQHKWGDVVDGVSSTLAGAALGRGIGASTEHLFGHLGTLIWKRRGANPAANGGLPTYLTPKRDRGLNKKAIQAATAFDQNNPPPPEGIAIRKNGIDWSHETMPPKVMARFRQFNDENGNTLIESKPIVFHRGYIKDVTDPETKGLGWWHIGGGHALEWDAKTPQELYDAFYDHLLNADEMRHNPMDGTISIIHYPNGKDGKNPKANTVMLFMSNDGHYYRFGTASKYFKKNYLAKKGPAIWSEGDHVPQEEYNFSTPKVIKGLPYFTSGVSAFASQENNIEGDKEDSTPSEGRHSSRSDMTPDHITSTLGLSGHYPKDLEALGVGAEPYINNISNAPEVKYDFKGLGAFTGAELNKAHQQYQDFHEQMQQYNPSQMGLQDGVRNFGAPSNFGTSSLGGGIYQNGEGHDSAPSEGRHHFTPTNVTTGHSTRNSDIYGLSAEDYGAHRDRAEPFLSKSSNAPEVKYHFTGLGSFTESELKQAYQKYQDFHDEMQQYNPSQTGLQDGVRNFGAPSNFGVSSWGGGIYQNGEGHDSAPSEGRHPFTSTKVTTGLSTLFSCINSHYAETHGAEGDRTEPYANNISNAPEVKYDFKGLGAFTGAELNKAHQDYQDFHDEMHQNMQFYQAHKQQIDHIFGDNAGGSGIVRPIDSPPDYESAFHQSQISQAGSVTGFNDTKPPSTGGSFHPYAHHISNAPEVQHHFAGIGSFTASQAQQAHQQYQNFEADLHKYTPSNPPNFSYQHTSNPAF